MKTGDRVTVVKIPDDLPDDPALRKLFKGCVGKQFTIADFDDDLAELHVGEAFGEAKEKHRIWLPAEFLKRATA